VLYNHVRESLGEFCVLGSVAHGVSSQAQFFEPLEIPQALEPADRLDQVVLRREHCEIRKSTKLAVVESRKLIVVQDKAYQGSEVFQTIQASQGVTRQVECFELEKVPKMVG
jgi:hypothetical protein